MIIPIKHLFKELFWDTATFFRACFIFLLFSFRKFFIFLYCFSQFKKICELICSKKCTLLNNQEKNLQKINHPKKYKMV